MIRRLNGRKMIMAFLRRSLRSKSGWRIVRARYGDVIYCDPRTGHVWAVSDDLLAAERARCVTMDGISEVKGPIGGQIGEGVGGFLRGGQGYLKQMTGCDLVPLATFPQSSAV
jgi:hypothetical protein